MSKPSRATFEIATLPEKGACGGGCARVHGGICRACDALPPGRLEVNGYALGRFGVHKSTHYDWAFTELSTGTKVWGAVCSASEAKAHLLAMQDPAHPRCELLAHHRQKYPARWGH